MQVQTERGRVTKQAESWHERLRLREEASILEAAAHPGVVRLLGTSGGDRPIALHLAEVEGPSLATLGHRLDPSELAGLGAALATTIADLHQLGIVHRAIRPEHVLLDRQGRPLLCGFGSAQASGESAVLGRGTAEDLAALARTIVSVADPIPKALRRVLGPALKGRGSAGALARGLVVALPSARLPCLQEQGGQPSPRVVPAQPTGHFKAPRPALLPVVLVGAAICVGCVIALVVLLGAPAHSVARGACPPADLGCRGAPLGAKGVMSSGSGRFELVGAGQALVAFGRWTCDSVALPAVLEPGSGTVWIFDSWPSRPAGVAGRLVLRSPGATGLLVLVGAGDRHACDRLAVIRPGRRALVVDPRMR